jgi:hypothetical protein
MASCEHGVRTLRGLLWRSSTLRWNQSPNVVRELNPTLLFARDTLIPHSHLMLYRTTGLHTRKEISGLNFGYGIYSVASFTLYCLERYSLD